MSLPSDVLDGGARRVRIAAMIAFSLFLLALTTNEIVLRFSDLFDSKFAKYYGTRERLLLLSGLANSVTLWWLASRFRSRPQRVLDVGLIFLVLMSLVISVVTEYNPRYDARGGTWVCLSILVWAGIAPSSPHKTLVAALAAASTVPLAIWFSHQANPGSGQPGFVLFWLVLPPYLCAVLAIVPATIMRRLGQQVRHD